MSQCSRHSQCVTTDLHTTRFSLNYKIYFKLAAISAFWEKYMIKQNSFRKRKRKRERIHLELVKWQVHSIGRRTNASSKCRETGRARTGGKAINSDPSVPKISLRILHTAVYIFPMILTRRICLTIRSFFGWWSFSLFSWLECLIQ